jgi:hypothetical protein
MFKFCKFTRNVLKMVIYKNAVKIINNISCKIKIKINKESKFVSSLKVGGLDGFRRE